LETYNPSFPRTKRPVRLRFQLVTFSAARTVLNTGHRMVYPFLPVFAKGLGVDLEAVALAVTARAALGLASPAFGILADRRGRRGAMLAGLLAFVGGMVLVTVWPTYPALFAALLLASVGKLVYDPAMQAYIGDRVHYAQRGLAIAITEFSWSAGFLVGAPLIGWLIARSGAWQAPFPLLAVGGLLGIAVLWWAVPSDAVQSGYGLSLAQGLRTVLVCTPALAALTVSLLISASNETVGIVYGAWMEDAFGLKVAALGAASAVIGIAELAGEGSVAGFVDRLGKRRAVALGMALNAVACLLLPVLGVGIVGALIGLFLFYITFEFAVVSAIPLMTELLPSARATLMSWNVAAFAAGRVLGSLIGPQLLDLGLLANGTVAAIFDVIALAALILFVRQD
jgi:predicted MFS family arabinose efflux permease